MCTNARENYGGTVDTGVCGIMSVFWISNIMTSLDGNYALGGNTCYWILPHQNQIGKGGGGAGASDDGKGGEGGLRAYLGQ